MRRSVLALSFALAVSSSLPLEAQTPPARILVAPFDNSAGEPRIQWLGEASAVLVADGLRARGVAAITREERVQAFEQLHLPLSATLSRATMVKVAELLGARELILGSFTVEGNDLTVKAHSIRVDAGRVMPSITEQGPLTDLFAVHERIVKRLAPDAPDGPDAVPHPPLGAFESYIKGLVAEAPATKATFLESALQDFPAFERARLALWEVRTDQGDHAAALAAVREIPSSSPLSRRARFRAAISMLNLERYDDAFETFQGLTGSPGGTPEGQAVSAGAVFNNLGVTQIRRGGTTLQSGSAVYFLTKATEADAAETDYLFNLGYAYVLDRNYQGALYWLRETLRRDPTDADAHFVLAAVLQATGSAVEAGRERDLARQLSSRYEELERRASADRLPVPRGLERLQLDADGSGALRADLVISSAAQREQRETAAFHLERARRLYDREQDGEALLELRRAVYLSPYEAQAHLLIGRIHLRAGRPAEAVDALKISIWSADSAAARVALAEAYVKTGDSKRARTEATRALAIDPGSADAKRLLDQIK